MIKNNLNLTAIDLFAGAGGLSAGLESAGFNILFANEIDQIYAESLSLNHPQTEILVNDIRESEPLRIRKGLGLAKGELDLLAGGPPCQGFSINAPIRTIDDRRNHLFLDYIRYVKEFEPKVVLIENVPGMISFENGETVRSILHILRGLDYSVDIRILYCANYGVPQMRYRTIIMGSKIKTIKPSMLYPMPTHKCPGRPNFATSFDGKPLTLERIFVNQFARFDFVTVEDAIGDLPKIENGGGSAEMTYTKGIGTDYQKLIRGTTKTLWNHECAGLGKANLIRLPHIPQGGSWRDIPHDLLPAGMKRARRSDHTKRYGRLHPKGISSTILTKCDPHWGSYIHYSQDRILSVREAARIQSFPDKIRFQGNLSQQYEQVGNAVPPLFGKALGKSVKAALEGIKRRQYIPELYQQETLAFA